MKKLLFLAGAIVLLAAACNSQQSATVQTPAPTPSPSSQTTQTTSGSSVDSAVNSLDASVDSETKVNSQSDADILDSDQTVVNDSTGVSNATY